jgi:two-component system, OmpR family, osmolarity sensor histidine kinase EnvZ
VNRSVSGTPPKARRRLRIDFFWRSFFLIGLLVLGSTLVWLQIFLTQEYEPGVVRNAHQIASMVNLTRNALGNADDSARVSLVRMLSEEEDVRLFPREPDDVIEAFGDNRLEHKLAAVLIGRLGEGTPLASSVNGQSGLWIGFDIGQERYWLQMNPSRLQPDGSSWLILLALTLGVSLLGAAWIASRLNSPLRWLLQATAHVREGQFEAARLFEDVSTREVRAVNKGFNRMVDRLANLEQERTLMLAGISHDLRTPLARLRLETEMSVPDPEARQLMAADIAQVDDIIGKFLDYARPERVTLEPVALAAIISRSITPWRNNPRLEFRVDADDSLHVQADAVELGRVLSNLIENARRHGQSPADGVTRLEIVARQHEGWVLLRVRDQGPGVSEEVLKHLTQPFYRADTARTGATGSGLGLAIVERAVQRMGGTFSIFNNSAGGLMALMKLRMASAEQAH